MSDTFHRSKAFRVSTSIFFSTAFLVAAIGVYSAHQSGFSISADSVTSSAEASLSLDKTSYIPGETVTYTIKNNGKVALGIEPEGFSGTCYDGGQFPTVRQGSVHILINYPMGLCTETEQNVLQPGATDTGTWNQQELKDNVFSQVANGTYTIAANVFPISDPTDQKSLTADFKIAPADSTVTSKIKLVISGGSIWADLLVAAILAAGTSYLLLREKRRN